MTDYNLEKEKNKIDNLFEELLNLSDKIKLEYILYYTKNISKIILNDFTKLEKIYLNLDKKCIDNKIKIVFLNLFLISKKQFEKAIDLKAANDKLESDILQFANYFSSYNEYLQNKIIMDHERAVSVAMRNSNKDALKKVYSCYQAMAIGVISILPDSFKEELENSQNFQDAFESIKILDLDLNLEINEFKKFYTKIIEEKLKEILNNEYIIDINGDEEKSLKRI